MPENRKSHEVLSANPFEEDEHEVRIFVRKYKDILTHYFFNTKYILERKLESKLWEIYFVSRFQCIVCQTILDKCFDKKLKIELFSQTVTSEWDIELYNVLCVS